MKPQVILYTRPGCCLCDGARLTFLPGNFFGFAAWHWAKLHFGGQSSNPDAAFGWVSRLP